jgi:hypothetical protein
MNANMLQVTTPQAGCPNSSLPPASAPRCASSNSVDGGGVGCLGAGLAPPERLKDKRHAGLLRAPGVGQSILRRRTEL